MVCCFLLLKIMVSLLHVVLFILEVVVVNVTTLTVTNRQCCVILDSVGKDSKTQLGQKKLVKSKKFFLQPNERLERRIQNVFVLGEDKGKY